jgi:MFS family permease
VEDAAINYQSPSIIAAGADAQHVSILAMMVNLMLSVICVKSPSIIERFGLTKKGALLLSFLNLCVWIPLISLFLVFRSALAPAWLVLVWLLNLFPAVLLSTQRDNWLSNLIPPNVMGRYLGQRLAIKSALYLGAFCLSGFLLDSFVGDDLTGFAIVFAIAFLAAFGNFLIYSFMGDPRTEIVKAQEEKPADFGFFDFLRELKERKLNTFILFTSLFGVTVSLCGPLYAVYMLRELHFSYLSFTLVISAEYLARVISVPFWGRFADKAGNIKVLNIVSRIIPLIPIFWLMWPNFGYFVFIQIISGACWGAYDLCTQNYLFKMAPPAKKLRYIVYNRSLALFCAALGGLLCVYLLNTALPFSGSRILGIFLISGVFRGLVVLWMVPRLVDFAMTSGMAKKSPAVEHETPGRVTVPSAGLYYSPDRWDTYRKPSHPQPVAGFGRQDAARTYYDGLFYHSEKWGKYAGKTAASVKAKTVPEYRGLYHDAEGWTRYRQNTLREVFEEIVRDRQVPVPVRRPVYGL